MVKVVIEETDVPHLPLLIVLPCHRCWAEVAVTGDLMDLMLLVEEKNRLVRELYRRSDCESSTA